MRSIKKIGVVLLLVWGLLQFFQPGRNETDRVPETDIVKGYHPPKDVALSLHEACYDCHSDNTRYPWYARVQPLGWFLEGHIRKGKAELNFSSFGSYAPRRQASKFRAIANSLRDGTMPPGSYLAFHKKARLSGRDLKGLGDWSADMADSLSRTNH